MEHEEIKIPGILTTATHIPEYLYSDPEAREAIHRSQRDELGLKLMGVLDAERELLLRLEPERTMKEVTPFLDGWKIYRRVHAERLIRCYQCMHGRDLGFKGQYYCILMHELVPEYGHCYMGEERHE